MYLEVKAIVSGIAIVLNCIVIGYIILLNFFLGFILLISVFLIIFETLLIGYQISHNHLKVLMDPCGPDSEVCFYFDMGGDVDFIKAKKGPYNTRSFVKYNRVGTIINKGSYPIRLINGNKGFIGHEDYPEEVNLDEAEALDKQAGEDIKEIVNSKKLEKIDKNAAGN